MGGKERKKFILVHVSIQLINRYINAIEIEIVIVILRFLMDLRPGSLLVSAFFPSNYLKNSKLKPMRG